MMAKYRKKPVVIEATQWFKNGDHPEDQVTATPGQIFRENDVPLETEGKVVRYFRAPNMPGTHVCSHCSNTMHVHGWIDTLEGGHIVCPGDWIIKGVAGEYYPCKPDIFSATYEKVE